MSQSPENFSMNPEQIAQAQQNPLSGYMRQPSIYLKLPSGGQFWLAGALEMPISGELPVLPMSTRDEIMLNTPDALLNGEAVVNIIGSCVPNIKNPWAVPTIDLDSILIAIRIASYGERMEYLTTCPQCENQDEYEVDLRQFMDMPVEMTGFEQPFDYKGMQIFIKPVDYEAVNMQSLEQFEQQRMVSMINDSSISEEEKQRRFTEIFQIMTSYTVKNVSNSIRLIVTPDGQQVSDPNHIYEFVENSERQLFENVRKALEKVNAGIPQKKVTTTCDSCSHEYETPFTFDQANFFAFAS